MDMRRLWRAPKEDLYKPEIPAIPRTLLVVKDSWALADKKGTYPYWTIATSEADLRGCRFERVLLHSDFDIHASKAVRDWYADMVLTRIVPGGTVKRLSRIDTITDMC